MEFRGFTEKDFQSFSIEGLDDRMEAIKENIQPKFKELGSILCDDLSALTGNEMHLHIAKHARRTVNPPKDTWLAICHDKRGYKKHPHFQIGLFDDHVFIWLAYIYELPNKAELAKTLLGHAKKIQKNIPSTYVLSQDHTKKESISLDNLTQTDFVKVLERFQNVKKAEFLIGRHVQASDELLEDGDAFIDFAKDTFKTLLPIYKLSFM
jgi:uncharacterized protein YktB (UPF0637 family)